MPPPDRSSERKNATTGGKKVSITEEEQSKEMAREIQENIGREINEGISNLLRRLQDLQMLQTARAADHREEFGGRVITLAGNNSGATMNLGSQSSDKHCERGFRVNQYEIDDQSAEKVSGRQHTTVNVYVNSNVQGVNNSILYNSSCTIRDPGVHLDLNSNRADNVSRHQSIVTVDDASKDQRSGGKGRASDGKSQLRSTSDVLLESNKNGANRTLTRTALRALLSKSSGNEPRHQVSESKLRRPRRLGFSLTACLKLMGYPKTNGFRRKSAPADRTKKVP